MKKISSIPSIKIAMLGAMLAILLEPASAQGTDERVCMGQAARFYQQKRFQEAIACYKQAVEINPDSAAAYRGIGLSWIQLKDYAKAFDAFEEALFINPNDAEVHYGMGIVYPLAKRNPKKAIEHYKIYLRLRPNAPDAAKVRDWIEQLTLKGMIKRDEMMVDLYNQGVDAYQRGEFEQAVEFYRQAMARNTHYASNHHALGLAYVRVGRYHDGANEFLETLKIDPRHIEAHYDLGSLYPVLKQYGKAVYHFTQYLKIHPAAQDAAQVRAWIDKIKGKIAAEAQALAKAPEIALYNEGVALYDRGAFEAAARAYEKAIEIQPQMGDALHGLGLTLIQLKQYKRACEMLQRARKIDPNNPENYYSLGVLHTLLGDPVSGVVSYQKYLRLYPNAPDQEKVQEWIEKLQNRLDIGFYNRGVEYYDAKNWDKALEAFGQALQYNGQLEEAQRMMGLVYLQMKDFPAALEALQRALEINPESPEVHYALGVAYTLGGDAQKSAEHYEMYKRLAPDAEDTDIVQERIARLQAIASAQ